MVTRKTAAPCRALSRSASPPRHAPARSCLYTRSCLSSRCAASLAEYIGRGTDSCQAAFLPVPLSRSPASPPDAGSCLVHTGASLAGQPDLSCVSSQVLPVPLPRRRSGTCGAEEPATTRGGVSTFHQKSTYLTQLSSGPNVAQIWSCNPRISEATKAPNTTVWHSHAFQPIRFKHERFQPTQFTSFQPIEFDAFQQIQIKAFQSIRFKHRKLF